jgi:hypothetical protein
MSCHTRRAPADLAGGAGERTKAALAAAKARGVWLGNRLDRALLQQ